MKPLALIINPPTGNYIRDDRCQVPVANIVSALRAPIDLLYYGTLAKHHGLRATVRDYPAQQASRDDFITDLHQLRPDFLIVNTVTPTLPEDLACITLAKEILPAIVTMAKGAQVTTNARELMRRCPELDIALIQEAEKALDEVFSETAHREIPGIMYRHDDTIVATPPRKAIMDLDWLPVPDRTLIDNSLYTRPDTGQQQTTILASRGCPNNCMFCLVQAVSGSRICMRSPRSIVDELEHCVACHGITNFYFRADTFTWHRSWVLELCQLIIERGLSVQWVCNALVGTLDDELLAQLQKAGNWMLGLGIESGNPDILQKAGKRFSLPEAEATVRACRRHGIKTYCFYVLGLPWDDEQSIKQTISFAKKVNSDFVEFHLAYPFPGTKLHAFAREHDLFCEEDLYGSNVMSSPMRTLYISRQEAKELRDRAQREYYLRPRYVVSALRQISSIPVLLNYMRYGLRHLTAK